MDRKMILKYQKLARLAKHTNDWLRKIVVADLEEFLYENRITTGMAIDGTCIRLSTIEKYAEAGTCSGFSVSIRPTTGIKPLYTTIATVTMNLIVSTAIVFLNPYVTVYIS